MFFVNNLLDTENKYKLGDIILVESTDYTYELSWFEGRNLSNGKDCRVLLEEGCVLEGSILYIEVNREAKAGEYVRVVNNILRPLGCPDIYKNEFLKCVFGKGNFVNTKTGINVKLSPNDYVVLEERE